MAKHTTSRVQAEWAGSHISTINMNTSKQRFLYLSAIALASLAANAQSFSFNGSGSGQVTPNNSGDASSSTGFAGAESFAVTSSGSHTHLGNGSDAVGFATGTWSGTSDQFGLTVSSSATHSYPATLPNSAAGDFLGYGANATGSANASWLISDLVFSGPASATLASINLVLSGFAVSSPNSLSGVTFSAQFFDPGTGALYPIDSVGYSGTLSGVVGGSDLLDGFSGGDLTITTGQFVVPVGAPLQLSVSLSGYSTTSGGYDTADAASAAGSLSFPTGGPVFNLSSGFTANAPSLYIADNTYSPVPEPEEYAAVAAAALIGFALWRRHR